MSYVVSIEQNQIVISRGLERHLTPITSIDDYYTYFENEGKRLGCRVEDLQVYNSSTMDFPEDSTSNPTVLALARELA